MDELQARHRKEQKDLQARITQKKKNATKKTRKGINDECERLERDLKEKQQVEIDASNPSAISDDMTNLKIEDNDQSQDTGFVTASVSDTKHQTELTLSDPSRPQQEDLPQMEGRQKKPNRQKARLARRAAEQEAQVAAAAEEASNLPNFREQELTSMKAEMDKRGLLEILIRPDGHCMYSACALIISSDKDRNYQTVRTTTADFIVRHQDDFSPFLEEPLDSFVSKIRNTAEWGGHLELQAIAKAYSVTINVLQANGHVEQLLPVDSSQEEIWLAYYKHSFGLGEHYNALKKSTPG